jgi:hypothetical protein
MPDTLASLTAFASGIPRTSRCLPGTSQPRSDGTALVAHDIIMAESRCDADQAFAMLSQASNNRNIKLRDLATEIVTQVGGRSPSQ